MSENPQNVPVVTVPPQTINVYPVQNTSQVGNDFVILNQELEIKSAIYNRSRIVYILTIIDIVFLIINLIVSIVVKNLFWLFFLLCPLCYFGNKGACEFKKNYILCYSIYLFIMSIYYMFLSFYANSFLILVIFFIELYFLFYTIKLHRYLGIANNEIIESLRNGWTPENVIIHYF